ncbi:HAAS signaling domain-containing protein [Bacillus suaedaesalsae]|uniref:DUF1700 domain-containing protein n=1 Tax=Bacillus suaedaesalsae TaxID=2810349 RepID=A0ABS2DM71_9BACI|nr:DUF1700 domain-containing protein [Bacillus suaedaesalsae]MBM6619577.1 DUF1700 domain-containing protein [Bacillus suaedaesalsae]
MMTPMTKENFLKELKAHLPYNVDKQDIIREWEMHIYDASKESECSEEEVIVSFGEPKEIAKAYGNNTPVQKNWVVPFYIGCNALFYIVGSLVTLAYHTTEHPIVESIWNTLIGYAPAIIGGYLLFWIFLGFEIGRTYGVRGSRVLSKTVLFCMLPNVILMVLTLYKWIPIELFESLLSPMFVLVCVILNFLLYPICRIAYRVGISRSL